MTAHDLPLDGDGLHLDRPGSITTYMGLRVEPLNMTPDDILIEDIAHALARQCRYNGHVEGYLSVARHCLMVADMLAGTEYELAGLLHDASEAYLGDMPRPLKQSEALTAFREADHALDTVVAEVFGLPNPLPDEVTAADRRVLLDLELPPPHGLRHTYHGTPEQDEADFLARYRRLTHRGTIRRSETTLVGLMGYAQAGKDTVGRILVNDFGFERVAFADALREMLYAINPIVTYEEHEDEHGIDVPGMRVQDIVDAIGWDQAKVLYPEFRELQQRTGTEGGREVLGEDIWVNTALAKVLPGGKYVITDVRFPNEARAIKDAGGELWRVVRPGAGPVNEHASETALDSFSSDRSIANLGTLLDLERRVHDARRYMLIGQVG